MKKLGIKYQLHITTLIPIFLVALLFAVFYNGQFQKDLQQHMSRLGETYIRHILPAAQFALLRNDSRTLQGLINASAINPEVKAIAFYNAQGQLLAYRGGKHPIHKPFNPPKFAGDYIENKQIQLYKTNFVAPITIPKFNLYSVTPLKAFTNPIELQADEILGWLSIDIDTQSMLIKRYRMYIMTILISLLGLLMSLTIHYFLSKRIYHPIARLRRSMKQILRNEFETQIKVSSAGELGIIEQGCAHLQKQYLSTISELNHHIELATADLHQSLKLLEEKNIELSLEKKKIEEKSKQKTEFIANMSHEIRTPMNGVIGFTNVLLESKLDGLQLDYVRTIKSSAQDLLAIINDILDYSKIDAGKLHLDCIPLDIRGCIDEVLALLTPNAHKKGIDLIASTAVNVPKMVLGDPLRIKQIITNLVSNAIKFTDKGYVLISSSIEQEGEQDYTLCLSVSDTGIGICTEDQTKLFNAFSQADTSITRRFGGSGLGLVICKKLVESMQGRIALSSEINQGSTFAIRIKLQKLAAYEVDKNQGQRFNPFKAICYDDNPLYLEALCNNLGYLGIETVPISSFDQLESAFALHNDSNLAFINVDENCEKLIEQVLHKQSIPSILVSKCLIHDPQAMGAHAFLFKPIGVQKLHDMIELLIIQTSQISANQELDNLRSELHLAHPEILIAEDNPVNRMLFNSLLNEHTDLEAVINGEEAVMACRNKHFDVILLDLQMPKLNGLDAARIIRQESILNKKTPILVISANKPDLNQEALQKVGIDRCIQKPIDEKQLIVHLLDLLKKSKPPSIDWQLCIQKLSGNQVVAEKFLARFVEELHKDRKELLQLLQHKDLKGLEAAVHRLYGACCFCGVPALQTQVIDMEKQVKLAKDIEEVKLPFAKLIQSIDEVIDEFKSLYQTSLSD